MEKALTSAVTWTFLDNLSEGVILVEMNGAIKYINQAAKSLLGLGQKVLTLAEIYQAVAPHEAWQTLLTPLVEIHLNTADGRLLNIQVKPCPGYDGKVVQLLINPVDPSNNGLDPLAAIEQLTALTRISSEPDFDQKLQLIVDGLKMTGWSRVLLTLRDADFNPTKLIMAGFTPDEREFLRHNMLPPKAWLALFEDSSQYYRRGSCYFVPSGSQWSQAHLGKILPDHQATGTGPEAWQSRDLLCIPLLDRQQRRIGLIGLDQPKNGLRPGPRTLQTIELYAQFAASVIENTQLVSETLTRSRELETLFKASHAISGVLEQEAVLTLMGNHMLRAVDAYGYTIYQWQAESEELVVLADFSRTAPEKIQPPGTAIAVNQDALVEQVLSLQKPLVFQLTGNEAIPSHRPAWLVDDDDYTCVFLPIVLSEETFGLIRLISHGKQQAIGERELQLLVALSNQASTALETALIFEDIYERERFYNALGSVSLAINFTLEREALLNLICSESRQIFNVDGVYIWQLVGDQFVGSAAKGHGEKGFVGATVPVGDNSTFVSSIASSGVGRYINKVSQSHETQLRLPQQEAVQAVLGVPLEQEGNIIGVLVLADISNAERFRDKDLGQVNIFGVQVAIALQNAKLFEELRRFNEELDLRVAERTQALNEESTRVKILLRISSELAASLDQDRVLNQALYLVNEVVNATQGVILLIDEETGELIFRAALGMEQPPSPRGGPSGLMRNEGLVGRVIDSRSAVIVHDTRDDPRWTDRPTSRDYRSVLGVPLISNEEVIGVLMLFHSEPKAFTMQQLDLVEAAAIQVANAINNANLYLFIRDQAGRLGSMLRTEQIETAKSQAILESIADGVIVADNYGKITLANLPASSVLDIPRENLIGKPVNELLGLYGHSGDFWIRTIEEWATNADRVEHGTYLADQLTIEDKVVSVHLSPVLAGNQFFGTVSIFRDITKEVEVDKLKSEFVSTVSHELRTPMTSIKGYADLMLMGAAGAMTNPQVRYLKVIKNNADRLHMLVNDLLNISRIETGKTTLDLRPVDVPQVIEQVVEGHLRGRIQHEGKALTVRMEIGSALPMVNADSARVTQILTNLLDNAFNYTPEQGEIKIQAEAEDNFVRIRISDSGIGIAEENQNKIFDRFFRAEDEAVQRVPGTGLGLAIVRSLIEMHSGHMRVESSLGKGSTFEFSLPVVVEDSDPT